MFVIHNDYKETRNTGEKITSIRSGEKLHETLINTDELRYTWEFKGKYIIFNPLLKEKEILKNYPKIKKVDILNAYSSNTVEKISKVELKKIMTNAGILN